MNLNFYFFAVLSAANTVAAAEVVQTCQLGSHRSTRITLVRSEPLASTHVYHLKKRGKLTPLFGNVAASRGDAVQAYCVGTATQCALVVSGEFTANAVQGVVLTSRAHAAAMVRMDFAEKSRPGRLYLGTHAMMLVIAGTPGEQDTRYRVYHRSYDVSEAHVSGENTLPDAAEYQLYRLGQAELR